MPVLAQKGEESGEIPAKQRLDPLSARFLQLTNHPNCPSIPNVIMQNHNILSSVTPQYTISMGNLEDAAYIYVYMPFW